MIKPHYQDKNVYITGGSSGIGLSIARRFSSLGAHVILFARGKDRLMQAIEEIKRSKISETQRLSYMGLDVSDHLAVKNVLGSATNEFGIPDIVINSAGIAYPDYFENISFDTFDRMLRTNLYGIWNTCSSLIPHMKSSGGHIVNISSIAGFIGVFGYTAYSASKFAVIGFSESLRGEMAPYNIRVSVLCPPDTDTPQLVEENRTKPAETKAIAGNAGLMSPDEVADAMIKGMQKKKFIIIPGSEGKFVNLTQRLFPGLVRTIMDIQTRKARKS